jgi:hypothetical protein
MIKTKCIKDTYTYKNELHHFLNVNIGDICLFEFDSDKNIYWFEGCVEKLDENPYFVARGLSPNYFFEMFDIIEKI